LDAATLEGTDAVVHLAGAGIADHRWSADHRRRVRDSRVRGTSLLAQTLARLERRPNVLVSASAIGFYGDRGSAPVTEDDGVGPGFLAEVCEAWEHATEPADAAGIRVVRIRTGIVLSPAGGALRKQLPLFRLGLGGRLASGRQYTSWIAIDDEVGAIDFALTHDELHGPVNLTAPNPVTNDEFTRVLAHVLHRPAFLGVPSTALRVVMGREMASELLIGGARVLPARLQAAGFAFVHPTLPEALSALLR
jgi:uncharacterized protein (TIGR01777 family)